MRLSHLSGLMMEVWSIVSVKVVLMFRSEVTVILQASCEMFESPRARM